MPEPSAPVETFAPPNETLWRLFVRFLKFGALAWGGPVAQIAMLREQLVVRERWISLDRFHRVLAVYQALPGPEAHELCVYFGMRAGGRAGAILAGLGFLLPGLVLMLLLSWCYVRFGIESPLWRGAMLGCQGAVAALIVRAGVRIGQHALSSGALRIIAIGAVASQILGANAIVVLVLAGALHAVWRRFERSISRDGKSAAGLFIALPGFARDTFWAPSGGVRWSGTPRWLFGGFYPVVQMTAALPSISELFTSGLRAGLLTFGGAYTAIPFLRADAVLSGRWMSDAQFLDGLALSSVLPAPFIIFSTFVGYLGGGFTGALVVTAGVFLPAFAFTLLGHDHLERVVELPSTHAFLDGVTAGVVGVIALTAWTVARGTLTSPFAVVIFAGALCALFTFKRPTTVAWVMGVAAVTGILWGGG